MVEYGQPQRRSTLVREAQCDFVRDAERQRTGNLAARERRYEPQRQRGIDNAEQTGQRHCGEP